MFRRDQMYGIVDPSAPGHSTESGSGVGQVLIHRVSTLYSSTDAITVFSEPECETTRESPP